MTEKFDALDLVKEWALKKYPNLDIETITGECTDGKVLIFYRTRMPKQWWLDPWYSKNLMFTISLGGRCWRSMVGGKSPAFSTHFRFADPNVFRKIDYRIKKVLKVLDEN